MAVHLVTWDPTCIMTPVNQGRSIYKLINSSLVDSVSFCLKMCNFNDNIRLFPIDWLIYHIYSKLSIKQSSASSFMPWYNASWLVSWTKFIGYSVKIVHGTYLHSKLWICSTYTVEVARTFKKENCKTTCAFNNPTNNVKSRQALSNVIMQHVF